VDARTPDSYRREVLLRETKNFWVNTSGVKYRRPDGHCTGNWPMYRLITESVKPLPTHTATLVKNDKAGEPNTVKDDFRKAVSLWDEGDAYRTIYNTTYKKADGYPNASGKPVRLEMESIKPFSLEKATSRH